MVESRWVRESNASEASFHKQKSRFCGCFLFAKSIRFCWFAPPSLDKKNQVAATALSFRLFQNHRSIVEQHRLMWSQGDPRSPSKERADQQRVQTNWRFIWLEIGPFQVSMTAWKIVSFGANEKRTGRGSSKPNPVNSANRKLFQAVFLLKSDFLNKTSIIQSQALTYSKQLHCSNWMFVNMSCTLLRSILYVYKPATAWFDPVPVQVRVANSA